jgi:hypothetical protein
MIPRGVYSVQPLCQVGQTPSPKPREDLTMGDEIVGMHMGTGVRTTVFAEIREGCSDKSPI